jgi:hypothetical protein
MLSSPTWWYFNIYDLKDILEITFFSSAIYYFSAWLKQDRQKQLLMSFYGYCTLLTICHFTNLYTAGTALILFAPVALIIFIVLHQELLQRNFITLHTITPAHYAEQDWTETLIRSCLVAVSSQKSIYCIIEKKQNLSNLLTAAYRIDCKLSEGLLDVLIRSDSFESNKMIWLKDNGTLCAINSNWKRNSIDTWLAQEVKEQEPWLQNALFFTSKTDALCFKINEQTRTFTLVAQAKVLEEVSAHAALKTIKKYLGHSEVSKKGEIHATGHKVSSTQQSIT